MLYYKILVASASGRPSQLSSREKYRVPLTGNLNPGPGFQNNWNISRLSGYPAIRLSAISYHWHIIGISLAYHWPHIASCLNSCQPASPQVAGRFVPHTKGDVVEGRLCPVDGLRANGKTIWRFYVWSLCHPGCGKSSWRVLPLFL